MYLWAITFVIKGVPWIEQYVASDESGARTQAFEAHPNAKIQKVDLIPYVTIKPTV